MFNNKNILVTGGTGMIGKALVEKLKQYNANITIADLNSVNEKADNVEYIQADLRYFSQCEELCKNKDFVFNVVGVKGSPQACATQPADFMVPMLQFNTNMMEAARKSSATGTKVKMQSTFKYPIL
jgi:GDP-L-fucose synthase